MGTPMSLTTQFTSMWRHSVPALITATISLSLVRLMTHSVLRKARVSFRMRTSRRLISVVPRISLCGKKQRRASPAGTHHGARAALAGTSSALLWQVHFYPTRLSISTLAVLILNSLTTTMRWRRARLTTRTTTGSTTSGTPVICTSPAARCPSPSKTSSQSRLSSKSTTPVRFDSCSYCTTGALL